jgi:hypothetical protein
MPITKKKKKTSLVEYTKELFELMELLKEIEELFDQVRINLMIFHLILEII